MLHWGLSSLHLWQGWWYKKGTTVFWCSDLKCYRFSTSYLLHDFCIQVWMPQFDPRVFLVQKICITAIEMVCCRTVLAIWENDKGTASWTLSVEYGYYWCTCSDGMSHQVQIDILSQVLSYSNSVWNYLYEHDFYVLSIYSCGILEVVISSTGA